ncbi:alpha/beta hydrolase [Hoeflea prorocentri]|uniref:Alpha/beta hydrolase n=1 Tax=Hoeflea prorocentri TaxID=1922333 RepID=A0A9X3UJT7_9HYPH|nr:alpha/beta hydrolase [Hoeflea prorocentri]MCY6382120.1 alpha/beta hydrolase [Hoeflea prorocentri]MDA5399920.1 alpha/beta hydrolase [Hoeflea prorocentri]
MGKHVVLIHGAFAGPWCMDNYQRFFEERGWTCHVPALRFHDGDPKAEPDPAFADTGIMDYSKDIAAFVKTLDSPPVIIGHAVAAIVAQQVAAQGLARGLVLINPNATWGMLPETDDERAIARAFMEQGPFWKAPVRVEFDLMAPFAWNRLDEKTQRETFEKLGPESGRVMFEMFFWMFDDNRAIAVDFDKVSCPVMVVCGKDDRAVRPAVGRQIAGRYGAKGTYHLAPDHAHFLFMEPGWETVAGSVSDWMEKH